MKDKSKPFFKGYRPQFYFRTEENKKKFGEHGQRLLPKAFEPSAITQAKPEAEPGVTGGTQS